MSKCKCGCRGDEDTPDEVREHTTGFASEKPDVAGMAKCLGADALTALAEALGAKK